MPSTASATVPAPAPSRCANSRSTSRPTIIRMIRSTSSSADGGLADQRAVAQDGGAVADLHHLLEPVGDEHDRDALGLEPAHDREQALHLLVRQGRGRLVHDHELGGHRQRAGDLDHLLLGDREVGDQPARVDGEPDLLDQRAGPAMQLAPVDPPQPNRQPADEDVLGDRQGRDQVEFLVDRDDAQPLRGMRAWRAAPRRRRRRWCRRRAAGRRPGS